MFKHKEDPKLSREGSEHSDHAKDPEGVEDKGKNPIQEDAGNPEGQNRLEGHGRPVIPADPTDQNLDQNLAQPADQNPAVPVDQNLAQPVDQNPADPVNQNLAQPADQNPAVPVDQNLAQSADQNLAQSAYDQEPADQNLAQSVNQNLAQPADQNPAVPVDQNLAQSAYDQEPADPADQNLDQNLAGSDDQNPANYPLVGPAVQNQAENPIQPIHRQVVECMKNTIKFRAVNGSVQLKVGNYFDVELTLGGDYRGLGGELGFTMQEIKIFQSQSKGKPTNQILEDWDLKDGNTLFKLMNVVRGLERGDIMELLEPEMERLSHGCNCESCGGNPEGQNRLEGHGRPVIPADPADQNLDQNLAQPADQNPAVPVDQNLAQLADQNPADPVNQNLAQPADQNPAVPVDQNLAQSAYDQEPADPADQNLDQNLAGPDDQNPANYPLADPAVQIAHQAATPIQPIHRQVVECMKNTIKFRAVNGSVQLKVGNYFDVELTLGGDYRSLGDELGFTMRQIKIFQNQPKGKPTKQILEAWDVKDGNTLLKLMNVVRGLERADIMELLEPEMKRLSHGCNCESCGGIN